MNKEDHLFMEEQKLLEKLVDSEATKHKDYRNALKHTISRINDEMKQIEEDNG